jgi:hypothetical protein
LDRLSSRGWIWWAVSEPRSAMYVNPHFAERELSVLHDTIVGSRTATA